MYRGGRRIVYCILHTEGTLKPSVQQQQSSSSRALRTQRSKQRHDPPLLLRHADSLLNLARLKTLFRLLLCCFVFVLSFAFFVYCTAYLADSQRALPLSSLTSLTCSSLKPHQDLKIKEYCCCIPTVKRCDSVMACVCRCGYVRRM